MSMDSIIDKGRAANILLVEDNPGDVIITKKAFLGAKVKNHIMVAETGEKAISLLQKQGEYKDCVTPDIILLDLNLPKKSGKEVLEIIKTDAKTRHIPVVVLTSSHAELDVVKSYNLHANSYIVKPVNLEKFAEVVKSIEQFWFTVTVLPDQEDIKI